MGETRELLEKANAEWQALLHPLPHGKETLLAIIEAYQAPGRYYHTLEHIAEMTLLLAEYRDHLSGTADVFLSCLYHDIVYDATKADNESLSAKRCRDELGLMGVPELQIRRCEELILATRRHQLGNDSPEMKFFLDADLAILGAEPDRYERYAHDVRYEYAHVPENEYRPGRSAVLRKFLERPRLYFTDEMVDRFEAQARKNLALEIQVLERRDSFYGEFSANASGYLTYNIDCARPEFYETFRRHLGEKFGFTRFSEPIWSPDSTIGTCGDGTTELEWGHDFFSGFYFYSSNAGGDELVRKIGESLNGVIASTEFNIYRKYLFIDINPPD